jgi:hypothetical protein
MTYVIDDDGKTNAQNGSHDDVVMSAAIILYVMEQYATPVNYGIVQAVTPISSDGPKSDFTMTEQGFRHKSEVPQDDDESWFMKAGW